MSAIRLAALVPMKAHSARVPEKNFRALAGRPLFQWIVETLLSISDIDRIVINTDARDRLETNPVLNQPRISIRDRRADLCGDAVSMNLVLADDVSAIPADVYLMTHTTNPMLSRETIERALKVYFQMLRSGEADSLFGVTRHQARFYTGDGRPVNHDPKRLAPTQELEGLLEENSTLYLFTRQSFLATGGRIGSKPFMFETPALESLDIDEESDWRLVEALAAVQTRRGN
jgi:CMP-N-acetylneuraminic acid synthetase